MSSVGLYEKHKPQYPHHVKVSPRGLEAGADTCSRENDRQVSTSCISLQTLMHFSDLYQIRDFIQLIVYIGNNFSLLFLGMTGYIACLTTRLFFFKM